MGKVMNRVADEGDGMTEVTTHKFRDDQYEGGHKRGGKESGGEVCMRMTIAGAVDVHESHSTSQPWRMYRMGSLHRFESGIPPRFGHNVPGNLRLKAL